MKVYLRNIGFFMLTLILCLQLFGFKVFQNDQTQILWGQRELLWKDFRGKPIAHSSDAAHITYSIQYYSKRIKTDSIGMVIIAVFYPNESWTKTTSDTVLDHEKRHFDLVEVYSRKIRRAISETKFTYTKFKKEIDGIILPLRKECDHIQDIYDKESNHSKDYIEQVKWNNFIKNELERLQSYSDSLVPIKIDWKR